MMPMHAADTRTPALEDRARAWFEAACSRMQPQRLQQLIVELTNIHSPTGCEAAASRFLADYLARGGLDATYQPVTQLSGNCFGRLAGSGDGPTLMLYAPIDTHLESQEQADVPWVGPQMRADMRPAAELRGDAVIGLGASNPKAMVATIVEAALCIKEAGVPLSGDLIVASAGGGMPWIARHRGDAGMSSGVTHLLQHAVQPDFAVILKPWDEVYYEHPGMAWFKVTVRGSLGYAGIPRGLPEFRSSIVPAARLILELERWLADYPDRHATPQVRPQGWISAVRAGWPDKPSFPSAACELYLDIRTNPDQTLSELQAEFGNVMQLALARHSDIVADWSLIGGCPGSRTDPRHWIVRSALRAWEEIHGRAYPGAPQMSGQTDAATIRALGIPVARIGFRFQESQTPEEFRDGLGGMGVARVRDMIDPCRQLIYMVVDSCTRPRESVGLDAHRH